MPDGDDVTSLLSKNFSPRQHPLHTDEVLSNFSDFCDVADDDWIRAEPQKLKGGSSSKQ
jgi:hypothetical protein